MLVPTSLVAAETTQTERDKEVKDLIHILEISAKRHGPKKPLTIGHLLNICKMTQKIKIRNAEKEDKEHRDLINKINPFGQD